MCFLWWCMWCLSSLVNCVKKLNLIIRVWYFLCIYFWVIVWVCCNWLNYNWVFMLYLILYWNWLMFSFILFSVNFYFFLVFWYWWWYLCYCFFFIVMWLIWFCIWINSLKRWKIINVRILKNLILMMKLGGFFCVFMLCIVNFI